MSTTYCKAIRKVFNPPFGKYREFGPLGHAAATAGYTALTHNGIIHVRTDIHPDPIYSSWIATPFTIEDLEA